MGVNVGSGVVGAKEGHKEGSTVGFKVGESVGAFVGINVGSIEGTNVGTVVGESAKKTQKYCISLSEFKVFMYRAFIDIAMV